MSVTEQNCCVVMSYVGVARDTVTLRCNKDVMSLDRNMLYLTRTEPSMLKSNVFAWSFTLLCKCDATRLQCGSTAVYAVEDVTSLHTQTRKLIWSECVPFQAAVQSEPTLRSSD